MRVVVHRTKQGRVEVTVREVRAERNGLLLVSESGGRNQLPKNSLSFWAGDDELRLHGRVVGSWQLEPS